MTLFFTHNDVVGPVGTYDYNIISAAPREINSLFALISVFDKLTWVFLLASIFAVTLVLVMINQSSNLFHKESIYQSNSVINKQQVSFSHAYVSGIIFCIGVIIDEAQGHQHKDNFITKATHSKARFIIVFTWVVVGFLMTSSFKSVLRAKMMTIEYEPTIDTVDDAIKSELPAAMAVDTSMKFRLKTDPRQKMQELAKQVKGYKLAENPKWVMEG